MPKDQTSELISAVKQYPVLYDKDHPDYKSPFLRPPVWEKLAKQCGFEDENIAKKKWKNIRDYYKRVLTEEKKSNSQSHKTWPYREQMEFLRPFMQITDSNVASDDSDVEDMEQINGNKKLRSTDMKENNEKFKSSAVDSLLYEYLKKKQSLMKPKDSLTKFFEYVETSVRAMSENRQLLAKHKISEILTQIEKNELDEKAFGQTRNISLQNASQSSPINFSQPRNPSTSISIARFHQQTAPSQFLPPFIPQEGFPFLKRDK